MVKFSINLNYMIAGLDVTGRKGNVGLLNSPLISEPDELGKILLETWQLLVVGKILCFTGLSLKEGH